MTKRLFVCHAHAAIESTSEVVDALENALDFAPGQLLTSSLPGYSPDSHSEEALRDVFGEAALVLALVSETSVQDAQFNFELGVAWSARIRTVLLLIGEEGQPHLPWPARALPSLRVEDPSDWSSLIDELSLRLAIAPRVAETAHEEVTSVSAPLEFAAVGGPVSVAPVMHLSPSEPPMASDVYVRLPTCEAALEAGRAVSDCLFNRAEISDFESELKEPLGSLVDSIGGSWDELRQQGDIDAWNMQTENLFSQLPGTMKRVSDWYKLGFDLAILHNLAGQLVLDGPDRSDVAEQTWRNALDGFLTRAEAANIGYENLGKVLGLLENLAGPRGSRDLANIGRSLQELRRYAAGADGIHTAA
jgi:hypothetical protein